MPDTSLKVGARWHCPVAPSQRALGGLNDVTVFSLVVLPSSRSGAGRPAAPRLAGQVFGGPRCDEGPRRRLPGASGQRKVIGRVAVKVAAQAAQRAAVGGRERQNHARSRVVGQTQAEVRLHDDATATLMHCNLAVGQ